MKTLQIAKLLLISIKNGELIVFPNEDGKTDYIQLLENAIKEEEEEMRANTKIIAAAPDLLEALKLLIEETENYVSENADNGRYLQIARDKSYNAIKKATK